MKYLGSILQFLTAQSISYLISSTVEITLKHYKYTSQTLSPLNKISEIIKIKKQLMK